MSEPNNDIPASMEALRTEIKDIETAITILQRIPPNAKGTLSVGLN